MCLVLKGNKWLLSSDMRSEELVITIGNNNNWYFKLERCYFIWGSVSHGAASLSVECEPFLYWSLQSCTDTAHILVHMNSQPPNTPVTDEPQKKTHAKTTKRAPCEARVGQGNELDMLKMMCRLPLPRTLLPCTVPCPLSVTWDLHPMLKYVKIGNWLCITKTRQTVLLVIVEFCVGGKSITASGKHDMDYVYMHGLMELCLKFGFLVERDFSPCPIKLLTGTCHPPSPPPGGDTSHFSRFI